MTPVDPTGHPGLAMPPAAAPAPPRQLAGGVAPVRVAAPMRATSSRIPRGPDKAVLWMGGASLFMSISRLHQEITPLAVLRAPFLLALAALLMLIMNTGRWRPGDLLKQRMTLGILVIAAFAFAGAPFSISQGATAMFLKEFYVPTLLSALIAWAVTRTPEGTRFMARTFLFGCLAAVVMAFMTGRTDSAGRLAGAYSYDPNDIALVAVVALPLAAWYLLDRANKFRFPVLASLPLCVILVVRSDSRGGFLGLASIVLGLMLLSRRRVPKRVKRATLGLALVAIACLPLLPSDYVERIRSITAEDDYNRTSESGRTEVWKRGIGYAARFPVFGLGAGNFGRAEGTISPLLENRAPDVGIKWSAAHNSFVQVIAELGFTAGIIFLLVIVGGARQLLKMGAREGPDGTPDLLGPFLGVSFIGFFVTGFFLSWGYHDLPYVLIVLGANILYQHRHLAPVAGPVRVARRGRRGRGGAS